MHSKIHAIHKVKVYAPARTSQPQQPAALFTRRLPVASDGSDGEDPAPSRRLRNGVFFFWNRGGHERFGRRKPLTRQPLAFPHVPLYPLSAAVC